MNLRIKAHIALFAVALIYAANYTIAKEVLDKEYIQPLGFILMRVVAGTTLFWIFHSLFIRERVDRADMKLLFLCGLTGIAINQMLFFLGLKRTVPINASLIMTTVPMVVICLGTLLGEDRFTIRKLLGIVIGAVGAILLITNGHQVSMGQSTITGDILIFLNAASYAIYLVLVKRLMKKYNPFTVLKWVFSFGLLIVLPFGSPEIVDVEWSTFPTEIWMAVVYVLLFTTFLAYLLNAFALSVVTPSVAGAYVYLQPLLTAVIALSFGKDTLTAMKMLAGMLIFLGVYLVTGVRKRMAS